jgi:hypothetical protein
MWRESKYSSLNMAGIYKKKMLRIRRNFYLRSERVFKKPAHKKKADWRQKSRVIEKRAGAGFLAPKKPSASTFKLEYLMSK